MDIFDQKNKENFMNIFGFIDGHFWLKKQRHLCRNNASRLCPLHTYIVRGAKFGFIAYKNQVWEFGDNPLILIPGYLYIPLPR